MAKQLSKELPVGFLATLLVSIVLVISLEAQSLFAETLAHYKELAPDSFLKNWRILGPVPVPRSSDRSAAAPTEEVQKKAFDTDLLTSCGSETAVYVSPTSACKVNGQDYQWKLKESGEEVLDLAKEIGPKDHAVAYALSEVESSAAISVIVGVGSDDAVKLWLNGKLVHQNWIHRPLQKDQDLVLLELRQGRNQLLMKIQNGLGDWGFACRALGPRNLEERLWTTAKNGSLDLLQMILAFGGRIQLNSKPKWNLTPWQVGQIYGRAGVTELLAAKGADTTLPSPKPEALVNTILTDLTKGMTPGAAVLVATNGEILFNRGYGFASLEHRVPVTSETKFRIGSVSKQFTAAAILRLQQEDKLDVHDPLSKFVPDYPRGKEVTIHQLLTHTSGIPDYLAKPDFLQSVTLGVKPEDWIQSFKNDPYDFDPGSKWAYSSSGYFLLGYIIEKVSGKTYAEYLKGQFFDPLEMRDTGVHSQTAIIEHEAFGYSYEGNRLQKAPNWDMSKGGGAGSLYSTVKDLYLWNEGLFAGRVLKEDSRKAFLTPVRTGSQPADENGYGYGVGIGKFRGLAVVAHAGGLQGFASHLARYPTEKVTIVTLANVSSPLPGQRLNALAGDIAQIYLAQKMESR